MFRIAANIGGWFDLFLAERASTELRNYVPDRPNFVGHDRGVHVSRLGMRPLADKGRPRFVLLYSQVSASQHKELVSKICRAGGDVITRLLDASTRSSAMDDVIELRTICQSIGEDLLLELKHVTRRDNYAGGEEVRSGPSTLPSEADARLTDREPGPSIGAMLKARHLAMIAVAAIVLPVTYMAISKFPRIGQVTQQGDETLLTKRAALDLDLRLKTLEDRMSKLVTELEELRDNQSTAEADLRSTNSEMVALKAQVQSAGLRDGGDQSSVVMIKVGTFDRAADRWTVRHVSIDVTVRPKNLIASCVEVITDGLRMRGAVFGPIVGRLKKGDELIINDIDNDSSAAGVWATVTKATEGCAS